MSNRQFVSRALWLAMAALLIAVGPAAAGDYSPQHLRAESFLPKHAHPGPDWAEPYRAGKLPFKLPTEFAVDRPLRVGSGDVVLRLKASPKLRRIVQFQLRF